MLILIKPWNALSIRPKFNKIDGIKSLEEYGLLHVVHKECLYTCEWG